MSERTAPPLRIAQVVTYVTEDGAFGGPVAVAVMQTTTLASLGHDVQLFAGWDGRGHLHAPGVRVRVHRAVRGRLPLIAAFPPMLPFALLRARRCLDVVHVHFGRDVVSALSLLALRGWRGRIVLQPHGMVMPAGRPLARVLDVLVVRWALARADVTLALTDAEQAGLEQVSRGRARIARISNGVTSPQNATTKRRGRPRVVFLARLHPRKNAPLFAEAALALRSEGIDADFVIAGPDEGDLPAVRSLIDAAPSDDRIRYVGPVAPTETQALLRGASLFVLPSVGEVFPMTVLESLAVGTPVVVTSDNGLADHLLDGGAALVTAPSVEALTDAMRAALTDGRKRRALAERGLALVRRDFSDEAVAARLVQTYRSAGAAR